MVSTVHNQEYNQTIWNMVVCNYIFVWTTGFKLLLSSAVNIDTVKLAGSLMAYWFLVVQNYNRLVLLAAGLHL